MAWQEFLKVVSDERIKRAIRNGICSIHNIEEVFYKNVWIGLNGNENIAVWHGGSYVCVPVCHVTKISDHKSKGRHLHDQGQYNNHYILLNIKIIWDKPFDNLAYDKDNSVQVEELELNAVKTLKNKWLLGNIFIE